ncbi:hypothetical protein NUW54_g7542 [Trametes sanguinea]|uniref:Uncharacterized protein n=1 Tax=Trametes sanguinea TaxID=158606 RepID=A0ACC1PLK2_9APHY|nr:hypothetical protein NUW54_g7542 [Trametes sanguinea]
MALRYEELGRLKQGHTAVIAISFSHRGTYIATAGVDDCTVCVWRVVDQKRLFTVKTSTAILSIEWAPEREDIFMVGSQGGVLSTVHIRQDRLDVKGFWAHRHPIEHLRAHGSLLASGAKTEVVIWRTEDMFTAWQHSQDLAAPASSSLNEESEILVTSLHWLKPDGQELLLLVTYMFHGIRYAMAALHDGWAPLSMRSSIFNTTDWSVIRNIPLPGAIAHSSVNPNGDAIAISNMMSGFDLYDLTSLAVLRSFTHPVKALCAVPVRFVHGGHALLGGSTAGTAHLWNVHNGRLHQKFSLTPSTKVMTVDANYDASTDRFLIAAGVSDGGTSAPVIVWMARDIGRRPAAGKASVMWPSLHELIRAYVDLRLRTFVVTTRRSRWPTGVCEYFNERIAEPLSSHRFGITLHEFESTDLTSTSRLTIYCATTGNSSKPPDSWRALLPSPTASYPQPLRCVRWQPWSRPRERGWVVEDAFIMTSATNAPSAIGLSRTYLSIVARTRTPALFLRPRFNAARFAYRTMATASNHLDVTHEIKIDHDNVRDLFERYNAATDLNEKTTIANTLIREMAIHGDAEEVSVYNDYAALGLGDTAAHNKHEHADIKKLVYDADATRVSKSEYDRRGEELFRAMYRDTADAVQGMLDSAYPDLGASPPVLSADPSLPRASAWGFRTIFSSYLEVLCDTRPARILHRDADERSGYWPKFLV